LGLAVKWRLRSMSHRDDTRTVLLETGRRIFSEKGYTASGLEAVLQAAGVPKGSFYYYFNSKEDFGLQVINHFAESYEEVLNRFLEDESLSPLERLRRLFESTVERLETQGCRHGCLVGSLSQEMANQSEVFRSRLMEIFQQRVKRFADCLRQAQAAGEVPEQLDVNQLAEFWLNSWQGAILRAKIVRSTAPLRTFLDVIFGYVLQA
jgi:TetR/AcrR family transcriptional regulator, transcriptional repressor for nem operon